MREATCRVEYCIDPQSKSYVLYTKAVFLTPLNSKHICFRYAFLGSVIFSESTTVNGIQHNYMRDYCKAGLSIWIQRSNLHTFDSQHFSIFLLNGHHRYGSGIVFNYSSHLLNCTVLKSPTEDVKLVTVLLHSKC